MKALIEYYDKLSESYDELYGEEQRVKYLKSLAFVEGERVLDVGCGTGLGLPYLGGRYVLCLDISLGMLRRAVARGGDLVDFLVADAYRLPLRAKAFDVALAITVFENAADAERLLEYADAAVAESLGRWAVLRRG